MRVVAPQARKLTTSKDNNAFATQVPAALLNIPSMHTSDFCAFSHAPSLKQAQ
jgi:hypothetical protein